MSNHRYTEEFKRGNLAQVTSQRNRPKHPPLHYF